MKKKDIEIGSFRIVQRSKGEFIVQRLCEVKEETGTLWWRKTTTTKNWKRVDKYGRNFFSMGRRIGLRISNSGDMVVYKTKKAAKKWTKNIHKYPTYTYITKYPIKHEKFEPSGVVLSPKHIDILESSKKENNEQ